MATGGVPTRKEEDFRYTCSLCMEPYRGRSPKILPCFHTFCLPCLTALQDSVTIATPERRPEQENQLTEDEDQKQPDSNSDEGKKQDTTSEGDDVTNDRRDASKYTVHKVHQRYTEGVGCTSVGVYVPWLDSHVM